MRIQYLVKHFLGTFLFFDLIFVSAGRIGKPEAYLDKHAFHEIVIRDGENEIKIQAKVLGHRSYAQGVEKIIGMILRHKLENRTYAVLDLIAQEML